MTTANATTPAANPQATSQPSTTERVAEKTHAAIDKVAESLDKTENDLRAQATAADQRLRELGAQAQQNTEASFQKVQKFAREKPFAAAGAAFAAGVIVSALLRR